MRFKRGDRVALKSNPLITGTVTLVKLGMAYHSYLVLWMNGQELEHRHQELESAE
jgi:hypothetical protein